MFCKNKTFCRVSRLRCKRFHQKESRQLTKRNLQGNVPVRSSSYASTLPRGKPQKMFNKKNDIDMFTTASCAKFLVEEFAVTSSPLRPMSKTKWTETIENIWSGSNATPSNINWKAPKYLQFLLIFMHITCRLDIWVWYPWCRFGDAGIVTDCHLRSFCVVTRCCLAILGRGGGGRL